MAELAREQVIGARLVNVVHSPYSEPVFILEGIGPAIFRTHYLVLDNGLILDLFTADITIASLPQSTMPGDTEGLPVKTILKRRIIALVRDDCFRPVVILEDGLFLTDANDGVHGNPLFAGRLRDDYNQSQLAEFVDFWTERPVELLLEN